MNINTFRFMAFAATLCCASLAQGANPSVKAKPQAPEITLQKILSDLFKANKEAPLQKQIVDLRKGKNFTEEELLSISEQVLKSIKPYDDLGATPAYTQLKIFMQSLVKELKDYQVSGVGFADHSSASFFYGHEKFEARIVFKNNEGTPCIRLFTLDYTQLGIQAGIQYRTDIIFTVGADLTRHTTSKPLNFNTGFFIAAGTFIPQIGVTVLPFKDAPGSMVIVHVGLGLTFISNAGLVFNNGTMTPKKTDK
jgi:hypothetical protein